MFYGMYRRLAGWLAEMHSALSDRIPWSKHQNLFRSGNISKLCFGVHSGWWSRWRYCGQFVAVQGCVNVGAFLLCLVCIIALVC